MSPFKKPSLRPSQIISTFGPGAIVDLRDQSVMIMGIDRWSENLPEIHEPLLENILNVRKFLTPSTASSANNSEIPATIFPRWFICPKCTRLAEYGTFAGLFHRPGFPLKCQPCNSNVYPARLIVACPAGHIDDFPWVEWTHIRDGKPICDKPMLFLYSMGVTSSLGDIRLSCKTCGAKTTLSGATEVKEMEKVLPECSGKRLWLNNNESSCNAKPRPVQRGASNVYFPVMVSSLSIPPWSRGVYSILNKYWTVFKAIKDETALEDTIEGMGLEKILKMKPAAIAQVVKDRKAEETAGQTQLTERDIREREFHALRRESSKDIHAELQTTIEEVDENIECYFSRITLVERLREVRVLRGFTRIDAPDPTNRTTQEIAHISARSQPDWLPAIDVRGEGIFLQFKENTIMNWAENESIISRAKLLNEAYLYVCNLRKWQPGRIISARFLLVHSFAHALMKQLSLDSGYSSASLRERLYIGEPEDSTENIGIAGLLIYTSTPDSEGSLGGLVRLGKKDNLGATVVNAIHEATWCSSDPLCMESKGQGPDSTNLAACHACLLMPETCCEEYNRFLDRGMLVGTLTNPNCGFFNNLKE